jgi:hypothetical protein
MFLHLRAHSYPELLRVTGPLQSLVLRAEDMWQRYNQCLEVGGALNQGFPFSPLMSHFRVVVPRTRAWSARRRSRRRLCGSTRRLADLIAVPCPMEAGAASSVADPSSRMRVSATSLFVSGEQTPMCVRLCPGEDDRGRPIKQADPEHGRG